MTFPKIYLGKFCQKYFFSYFYFLVTADVLIFNKVNSCEIENSTYFDAMVEMVYFLE